MFLWLIINFWNYFRKLTSKQLKLAKEFAKIEQDTPGTIDEIEKLYHGKYVKYK